MKKICLSLLVLLLSIGVFAQQADISNIKKTYKGYTKALAKKKGEAAANFVDQKTIRYYDSVIHWVRTADSNYLERLTLMDKMMVLLVRHRCSKEAIQVMNGKQLLIFAVNEGMSGKNVADFGISHIEVSGNKAFSKFKMNKHLAPYGFSFNKENKAWKVDLTSVFPFTIQGLKQLAKENSIPENVLLFNMMAKSGNKEVKSDIWKPVH